MCNLEQIEDCRYKKTADAEFLDGKIIFRDEAGLKAEAAVDWKFLAD